MVPEDKRTKMGPIGVSAVRSAVVVSPSGTPAPIAPTDSQPPGGTSYLPPATDPMLGQMLAGRYLIQRKLGEGGMGAVYMATHTALEKQVALKVLHGEFARKPDLVERFMQEARSASRIRHENVIDISDFGTTSEGMVFFAMELLQGHDLHEEIARARLAGQLLPWERSKKIFLQICSALGAAHALGIIHRDLKPENIYLVEFLGDPDFVKLLDFGIAKLTEAGDSERKLTRTGMLFGTPEYMSPEQARGEAVDARVDVYAMGCILFQLVTGRVPFEAENFMGVLTMHLTEPPPVVPPEILDSIGAPRALAQVIEQALAKDRNQRFASVDELAHAVRRASGDKITGPVTAPPNVTAPATGAMGRVKTQWTGNLSVPEIDPPPAKRRSRVPLIVGAVMLACSAAALAAVIASRPGQREPPIAANAPAAPPVQAPTPPPATPSAPAPAPAGAAAPPPAESPLAFARSRIKLDSVPSGAEIRDPATGKSLGHTPLQFTIPASHTARQFELRRKDYVSAVVEIVPELDKIEYTEKLERGAAAAAPVVHHATPSAKPATDKPAAPDTTGPVVSPPAAKPDAPEPAIARPEIKDPPAPRPPAAPAAPAASDSDAILLKPDPSRAAAGSGGS